MPADLPLLAAHTSRLVETVGALADLGHPSLCDGWTRGHVVAHVARNADAIGRLAEWAVTGHRQEMYPGGAGGREAEIAEGAGRPHAELVLDLTRSAAAVAQRLEALDGGTVVDEVELRGGLLMESGGLPFLRLREVVYHHVDLDAGFTFGAVEPDLLRRFIGDSVARLELGRRRRSLTLVADEGDRWVVGGGETQVRGSLAGLLLWLARRIPTGVRTDGDLPELPRGA